MRKKSLNLVVLALFCVFGLLVGSLLFAAEQEVSFQDDFNTISKDNWDLCVNPDKISVKDGVMSMNVTAGDIRMTSFDLYKFGDLEAKVRYTQPFKEKRYYYIGFADRGVGLKKGSVGGWISFNVTGGGTSLVLQCGRGKEFPGKYLELPLIKPVVNQWYVLKISWQPKRLEFFVDGKSYGYTDDPTYIPQGWLAAYIDAVSDGSETGPVGFDIDYVKVTSQGE